GSNSSSEAPMPLSKRSGRPCPVTETRRRTFPSSTICVVAVSRMLMHIAAGRGHQRRMERAAQLGRRRRRRARALAQPRRPMVPPRAALLARALEPAVLVGFVGVADEELRLLVAGRIDDRLNMAARALDEGAAAAEQARRAIAGLPRGDV